MGRSQDGTPNLKWKIEFTSTAAAMLLDIGDARVRRKISETIDDLATAPDVKGKPLWGELKRFYWVRAVGQRYRIVYSLNDETIIILIVAVGLCKEGDQVDIYRLAQKLVALGLTQPPAPDE